MCRRSFVLQTVNDWTFRIGCRMVLSVSDHQLCWIFIVKKFSTVVMIDTLKTRNGRWSTVTVTNQLAPSVWLRLVPVDQRFLVLLISLLWSGRTVAISGRAISTEFLSIRSTWLRLFHHLCLPTHTHPQKKGKFLYRYFLLTFDRFRMRGANRNGSLLNGDVYLRSFTSYLFFCCFPWADFFVMTMFLGFLLTNQMTEWWMAGGGKLNIAVSVFGSEGFLRRISDPAKRKKYFESFLLMIWGTTKSVCYLRSYTFIDGYPSRSSRSCYTPPWQSYIVALTLWWFISLFFFPFYIIYTIINRVTFGLVMCFQTYSRLRSGTLSSAHSSIVWSTIFPLTSYII